MNNTTYQRFKNIDTEIQSISREIKLNNKKIASLGMTGAPKPISAIDYSKEPIQSSPSHQTIFEIATRICNIERDNVKLFESLDKLRAERAVILSKAITRELEVYLWWLTGRTNQKIAEKVGLSKRQVERYTSKFKDVGLQLGKKVL